MKTIAIKWDEKILVTSENKDSLIWYEFILYDDMTEDEKLDFEKQELEICWYIVEIIDWCCVKTETDESKKYEIKLKLNRMHEIRLELAKNWFTSDLPSDERIDSKLQLYKQDLLDEWNRLKNYVDENYESNLIDDVINSFFS